MDSHSEAACQPSEPVKGKEVDWSRVDGNGVSRISVKRTESSYVVDWKGSPMKARGRHRESVPCGHCVVLAALPLPVEMFLLNNSWQVLRRP